MKLIPLASCGLCAIAPSLAQQFVVDPAGGAGTSYTSLDAAIAAVPDGSTLIVRAAIYPKVVIAAKGLTILCDPGVRVQVFLDWYLTIQATSPTQPVYVRGLIPLTTETAFQVLQAQGPVCIDGQGTTMSMSSIPIFQAPTFDFADQVLVRQCSIAMNSATSVTSSQVVFEDCTFLGRSKTWFSMFAFLPPSSALALHNSRVQLVRCSATGGLGDAVNPSQPAVEVVGGSHVRVLRSGNYVGGGGGPAFVGIGNVRAEPGVGIVPGMPVTIAPMPSLAVADAAPGGTITATHFTTNSDPFLIGLGLPGPSIGVPGILDPVWVDPAAFVGLLAGVGPAPIGAIAQSSVPPVGALVGVRLVWQSFAVTPAGVEASNPGPTVVR